MAAKVARPALIAAAASSIESIEQSQGITHRAELRAHPLRHRGRRADTMPSPVKKKKLSYPEESEGSRTAAETRRRANGQSGEQRREHFRQAMAMIYAGRHDAKATGAGH